MTHSPEQVIRPDIRDLNAYHVPDSAGMIKLDAMENPYPLPQVIASAVAARLAEAALNRYPDPRGGELKPLLRTAMQIPDGMDIVLGNGSDELIQMLALATATQDSVLLSVEPSFVMFRMIAGFVRMRYVGVPLSETFTLDADRMLAAIEQHRPALVFIAYPNNPTGNLFDAGVIEQVIKAAPGIVVVDEAYHAFAGASMMARLPEFENLLVMRTLSKLGLAGLRLGLLAGNAALLRHIDKVRLPYNVNVLTQLAAAEALRHQDLLDQQAAAIRDERGRVLAGLQKMPQVQAYPSDANFILFRVSNADQVFVRLKEHGVLIKNVNSSHPLLKDCLRTTIGTPQENGRFLEALAHSF